ncbi:hydroxyacylglutathione hydrolase [Pseudoalteromonas sp. NBT06-2]|uniref:hydroxyacylglutathione hydrolase n=1 Tax=Pseudoalteromonas sp. NBT06-2 TaxID=2025950 RepID=UPI000BA70680|nr:hydroxyacylglutathione hydrolase [Pseudoalteromonas sp. NBT06-2]PAJ76339.1 hydroxyacylglutathione hydrolase [Pseudoalteromonas sp. NBT06-2]
MLTIFPIQAFSDNYIWAITINGSKDLYVVDPGQSEPVVNYIAQHNLSLKGILITHHHWDHTDGVTKLKQFYPDITVYGPQNSIFTDSDITLKQDDSINILGVTFNILSTPGHTLDHICYYNCDILFCGDTLFSAGCGRLFEGTPKHMFHSLQKIAQLNKNCKVYCTHEYTEANIAFAQQVDPKNLEIQNYKQLTSSKRNNQLESLPSTIAQELKVNPYLKSLDPSNHFEIPKQYIKSINKPESNLANLRSYKDNF